MTLAELEQKVLKLADANSGLAAEHDKLKADHANLLQQHGALQKKLDEMSPVVEPDGDEPASDEEPADLPAAKKMLADAKAKLAEYAEKAKSAEEAKQMAEKETKFNLMLSEGKACAAQKDAFMKNDMIKFAEAAQPVNLNAKGTGGNPVTDAGGDRADKVLKLAEEKCRADSKLAMHDAIKLANKEITE